MEKSAAGQNSAAQSLGAPRGRELSCKGWAQEAALRMLLNSHDPEVALPPDLTLPGGESAADNSPSLDAACHSLRQLENDESLIIWSGKPAGVFRTQADAPRVLMPGPGPLGGWARMGAQGTLADTYAVFAAAGRQHFAGKLAGKLIVSGGMGRRGGVQPLAAMMLGAAILSVEIDPQRIKHWVKAGYCDVMVNSLDEALRILKNAVRKEEPASVGLVANSADTTAELARRGVVPDLLTDQTPVDSPDGRYVPRGLTATAAEELRRSEPEEYRKRSMESIARQASGMAALAELGAIVFEWGNGIREMASAAGVEEARNFLDYYAAYLLPLLSEAQWPVRWFALSGEAEDIRRIDRLALALFGDDENLSRWIGRVARRIRFQGLPARACWLRYGQHERLAVAVNHLVRRGELKAPAAIAAKAFYPRLIASRDASPRQAESCEADWAFLSALLHTAPGTSWMELRKSKAPVAHLLDIAAEFAIVADGGAEMDFRIGRLLAAASELQVARLAETGHAPAIAFARSHGIQIPPPGTR